MKKLYVVGIGPGEYDMMTGRAIAALQSADVIVGYQVYTELVKEYFPGKEIMTTPMRQEVERCRMAVREAAQQSCCHDQQWRCRNLWYGRAYV